MYDFLQLKEVVATLGEFRNLRSLHVPFSADLTGHGSFGIGFCGNVFRGLNGRYRRRKLRRERIWAVETFASIILDRLPHLQSLGIDGAQATTLGDGVATWPWTGRMGKYIKRVDMYCPVWGRNGKILEPENPDGPVFGEWHLDERMLQADWKPSISGQYESSESENDLSGGEEVMSEGVKE
ncbi:hypothetical protein B0J13DRAFT_558768 [Dactylonectria estremocensis]|uniref:Uncharacterized protein n=1 Tax=Dactylonectria estremocensis TaxID=1079267 RepID=A0A9P9EI66_9HYPO|nr:hypothetical protein B0J13DRAFT_558768 [Dactylonectria estremocensis]